MIVAIDWDVVFFAHALETERGAEMLEASTDRAAALCSRNIRRSQAAVNRSTCTLHRTSSVRTMQPHDCKDVKAAEIGAFYKDTRSSRHLNDSIFSMVDRL